MNLTPEECTKYAQEFIDMIYDISKIKIDYTERSIKWLSRYIQVHLVNFAKNIGDSNSDKAYVYDAMLLQMGSFLGEVIIHNYDGYWKEHDGTMAIFLKIECVDLIIYPFDKVKKQCENGEEDCVYYYYKSFTAAANFGKLAKEGHFEPGHYTFSNESIK